MSEWSEARRYFHRVQDEIAMRDVQQRRERGWQQAEVGRGVHTMGDLVGAILAIDNAEDARRFYEGYVEENRALLAAGKWESRYDPEEAVRANIGWCYGEGMAAERVVMWRQVCGAEHPVFGATIPGTPEQALAAGLRIAQERES